MLPPASRSSLVLAGALILAPTATAQTTQRVSLGALGGEGSGSCRFSHISADGRYVVYNSTSPDLVTNDGNGVEDCFWHDRLTGETRRVSVDSQGNEGNDVSGDVCVSHDGMTVAFVSYASNLVGGDNNGKIDVFVHDLRHARSERVSVSTGGIEADGASVRVSISGDGRMVSFDSLAGNLAASDSNGSYDVFVHDRRTGVTTCVSLDALGQTARGGPVGSTDPSLSGDGRWVAFASDADNLVAGDTNAVTDIFLRDLTTGLVRRVSVGSGGIQGSQRSVNATVSQRGRFVGWQSMASEFVPGDVNGHTDAFVHDVWTGVTERCSVGVGGAEPNGPSYDVAISDDGRIVSFHSLASNLTSGDLNGHADVFLVDREHGRTTCVSMAAAGLPANGDSSAPSVSADGRMVVFESDAANLVLGDLNGQPDVFVHVIALDGPRLTGSGPCPGTQQWALTGATPNSWVLVLAGPAGASVLGTQPCRGTVVDLEPGALRAWLLTDAAGAAAVSVQVPVMACGWRAQAVDVAGCKVGPAADL